MNLRKVSFLFLGLIVCLNLAACGSNTNKDRFRSVIKEKEYELFLDMNSITYNKTTDTARYWVKAVYTPEGKKLRQQRRAANSVYRPAAASIAAADYNLALQEVKLSDRKARSAEFIFYSTDGRQLHKEETPTVWSNIEPNSAVEKLFEAALPTINKQK